MANNMMNMQQLMKQAQKMQKQMEATQNDLKKQTFTGTEPSGMIEVTATGNKKITAIKIKPEAIDPDDPDMLEDLVLTAVNNALGKVDAATKQQLGAFTKGIPGF
ncbi:MAG: YbaB/EbfC family nucleoid-associated protein [Aerococcus sp.]|nr:YbaB/EbfC family nucleoid-associated protein [Aerococcus sp.]